LDYKFAVFKYNINNRISVGLALCTVGKEAYDVVLIHYVNLHMTLTDVIILTSMSSLGLIIWSTNLFNVAASNKVLTNEDNGQ